jgi:hypothetical protein
MFSLSLDYDDDNPVTVSGYASLWGWNRKKVKRFLNDIGVEIAYPDSTTKTRNQRGHIIVHEKGHKPGHKRDINRDIKGTKKGQIRFIDSKWIEENRDIKGTKKGHKPGHKRDINRDTTIDPNNPNPNPKKNIRGFSEAFEKWWGNYPARNGRKVAKAKAAQMFNKISKSAWNDLKMATDNYSRECNGLPKDADRFLRNGFWKDFLKEKPTVQEKVKTYPTGFEPDLIYDIDTGETIYPKNENSKSR